MPFGVVRGCRYDVVVVFGIGVVMKGRVEAW